MYQIIAAILVLFSGSLLADSRDEVTIIPTMPTYTAGESEVGIMTDPSGATMEIRQRVQVGSDDEELFLIREFVVGEDVAFKSVVSLATGKATASAGAIKSASGESTCKREEMYPITLGKVYECDVVSVSTGGVTVRTHLRFEFDRADYDEAGNLLEYCALEEEDHGIGAATTRVCYSPDGKWIRSATILESVVRIKT